MILTEAYYFDAIITKDTFTRQDLLQSFRDGRYTLGNASFCKKIESLLKEGNLVLSVEIFIVFRRDRRWHISMNIQNCQ